MIAPGTPVRWDSGPRFWGGAPRTYTGIVLAVIPRRASAWALPAAASVPRDRRKCTDVIRAFDRALVEVAREGAASVLFAPDLRRLTVLEEVRRG